MNSSSINAANDCPSAVENIKHVIVLMFENRSFDHILGAMPGVDGVLDAHGIILPDLYNTMDPTKAPGDNNTKTLPTPIVPFLYPDPQLVTEDQLIPHDFTHEFGDGMLQDIFGPGTTGLIDGLPQNNPAVTYPSTNSGFLSTIAYNLSPAQPNGKGAMTYFKWGSMEVFHKLAESFLVCDQWHCDMPGHTAPNRAFMHCATTGDIGIDDDDRVGNTTMVNRKTIFERIQETKQTWKMYWPGMNCDTDWLNEQVSSQHYNPNDPTANNVTLVPIQNFFTDLEHDHLPFYSFIMCWNPNSSNRTKDTSMHPASRVEPGETMLACIYNSLRGSKYWKNTLLIVNFDENGGMYDHQSVPNTTPPDCDRIATDTGIELPPIFRWQSYKTNRTYSFDFGTLGVRIPVLLISPWLNAGVCSTQYQNTSILRFLQDMLPGANPDNPYFLTQRDLNACSIAPVFCYAQFGRETARTDCPTSIRGYGGSDACAQFLADIKPDAAELAAPPAPHVEGITRKYISPLPGHPDSGKPLRRSFKTVGEMLAYVDERRAAALAYIKARSGC